MRSIYASTFALALTASGLFASTALCDDSVTVELNNGDAVRGELVERVGNVKYVIKLATGEVRTIAWADINFAKKPESPVTPAAGLAVGPAPAPAKPPESTDETAKVHIESDYPGTQLQRMVGTGAAFGVSVTGSIVAGNIDNYATVCTAPCTVTTPTFTRYQVDAPGMTTSQAFLIPTSTQGTMQLKVKGGSFTGRIAGLMSIGIAPIILGGSMVFAVLASDADQKTIRIGALVGVGLGAAWLALGIYAYFVNGTDVIDGSGKVLASQAPRKPLPKLRFTGAGFTF